MRRVIKKLLDKKPLTMLVRSISMRLSGRRKKDKDCNGNKATGPGTLTTSTSSHSDCAGTAASSSKHNSVATVGNIHRIQEVALPQVTLTDEYDVQKTLAEGCFAKILLATHRGTKTTVVLKAVHTELTTVKDFQREYHYSYHLSPHPAILSSYAVCFRAEKCLFFAQEQAPLGDLSGCVHAGGLPEKTCKEIARQLVSALDFMHSKQLVHRDVKLENVLVFEADLSKVKLCDFGATRKEGSLVSKPRCSWPPFVPPELYEVLSNERYHCRSVNDTWQLAVLVFVCLTGCPPWQNADAIADQAYASFWRYQRRRVTKIPYQFRGFTPRLLRMFRRMFEHKQDKRAPVSEVTKYLEDAWIDGRQSGTSPAGGGAASTTATQVKRADSPQSYVNRHGGSDDANKTRLKRLLSSYGLETTVDQKVMTKRVWDWVLSCDVHPADSEPLPEANSSPDTSSSSCSRTILPVC